MALNAQEMTGIAINSYIPGQGYAGPGSVFADYATLSKFSEPTVAAPSIQRSAPTGMKM